MIMRRFAAILTAIAVLFAALPLFAVDAFAASAKVTVFGNKIPVNTEKICFIEEGNLDPQFDFEFYTDGSYKKYYTVSKGTVIDCKQIAAKFPKLKRLTVIYAEVSNVSDLSKLAQFRKLELYNCDGTENISFLKKLPKLTMFHYVNWDCESLKYLKYLTDLTDLRISAGNEVLRTLAPIKNLKKLKKLDIRATCENLDEIAGLTSLTHLSLSLPCGEDISAVANFKNLVEFDLGTCNDYLDISAIGGLKKLKRVYLQNDVKSLEPLKKLKNIEKLGLYNFDYNYRVSTSDIKDVVSGMTGLKELTLLNCGLWDCKFLSGLKKLEVLSLEMNHIEYLTGLEGMKKLRYLGLNCYDGGRNELDLSAIKNLTQLESLALAGNTIKSISPLSKLVNLEWLGLSDTGVKDLSPLLKLSKLKKLVIYGCADRDGLEAFSKKYPDCEVIDR